MKHRQLWLLLLIKAYSSAPSEFGVILMLDEYLSVFFVTSASLYSFIFSQTFNEVF